MSKSQQTTITMPIAFDTNIRRDMEDLVIQMQAALQSAGKGCYATAKAELRGAILALDRMEARGA